MQKTIYNHDKSKKIVVIRQENLYFPGDAKYMYSVQIWSYHDHAYFYCGNGKFCRDLKDAFQFIRENF